MSMMDTTLLDPNQLRLPPHKFTSAKSNPPRISSPKPRSFLKGPIPLPWLELAAGLPGKALHVGMMLWYLVGLGKNTHVVFSYKVAKQFHINRHAAYRALKVLQEKGLIRLKKGPGESPRVVVMEVDQMPPRESDEA